MASEAVETAHRAGLVQRGQLQIILKRQRGSVWERRRRKCPEEENN